MKGARILHTACKGLNLLGAGSILYYILLRLCEGNINAPNKSKKSFASS